MEECLTYCGVYIPFGWVLWAGSLIWRKEQRHESHTEDQAGRFISYGNMDKFHYLSPSVLIYKMRVEVLDT